MDENTDKQGAKFSPPLVGGIILAVILVAAGWIFVRNKNSTPSASTSSEQVVASPDDTNAQVINVEAGSFYFKPAVINATVGHPIKIVMTSVDMAHNFNIDELNVHTPPTPAGTPASVVFTPTQAGTYEYYCSIDGHRQKGQVGKLIVE